MMNNHGISNLFDVSEVWNDDDLKMFVNLQTPIHKKKDDLLFPQDEIFESTPTLSDLSISPLVPIRASRTTHSPPSSNNIPSSAKLQVVSSENTGKINCAISKKSESVPMSINSIHSQYQHPSLPSIPKPVSIMINDENSKPQNTAKQIHPPQATKPVKSLRILEPSTKKTSSPPKKSKLTKQTSSKSVTNAPIQPTSIPLKEKQVTKQKLPSPIPPLSKAQQPTLSIQQLVNIPVHQSQQISPKQNSTNPPPLPNHPPQQLVLKLFEEKQKRFFNKFEDDSLLIIDYISNYSIVK